MWTEYIRVKRKDYEQLKADNIDGEQIIANQVVTIDKQADRIEQLETQLKVLDYDINEIYMPKIGQLNLEAKGLEAERTRYEQRHIKQTDRIEQLEAERDDWKTAHRQLVKAIKNYQCSESSSVEIFLENYGEE